MAKALDNVLKNAPTTEVASQVTEKSEPATSPNINVRHQDMLERRNIHAKLSKQDTVVVTISPMYRKHFGKNMKVEINGVAVYVPVDGSPQRIAKDFAALVHQRIRMVDDKNLRRAAQSRVVESWLGQ